VSVAFEAIDNIQCGSHVGHLYHGQRDLVDTLVAFFKKGLESNEFCLWVTSEPLSIQQAEAALHNAVANVSAYLSIGQLEILNYRAWHMKDGQFHPGESFKDLIQKEIMSIGNGFNGLRVAENMSWLEPGEWPSLVAYESVLNRFIRRRRITMVCSYCLEKCGPAELVNIIGNHSHCLVESSGRWELIANPSYNLSLPLAKGSLNYAEIGRLLGISRERVRRIVSRKPQGHPSSRPQRTSKKLLTSGEAAEILGVHVNTIRRWSNAGMLPSYRVGSRNDRKFKLADLHGLMSPKAKLER
jgi:excisionase family DNA binding protein